MSHYQSTASRMNGRYRRRSDGGLLHTLLFYILPFLVFNGILFYCVTATPHLTLEIGDTSDYLTTEATFTIRSWFPTRSISVNLDGETLELGDPVKHTYTIPIYKNGLLEASVTNINGMVAAEFVQVNILDDVPPTIEDAQVADGVLKLTFTDSQSGIDFDTIYAVNSAGEQLVPLTVDRSTNTLSFEMDPAGLNVYAQDKAGNQVQGSFTSHKEGEVEMLQENESSDEASESDVQVAQ